MILVSFTKILKGIKVTNFGHSCHIHVLSHPCLESPKTLPINERKLNSLIIQPAIYFGHPSCSGHSLVGRFTIVQRQRITQIFHLDKKPKQKPRGKSNLH